LVEKFAEGFAERRLIEILRAGHGEACGGQRIGDQARVIGGGGERAGLVLIVADDKREAHLLRVTDA
jgi:hypothetical protein